MGDLVAMRSHPMKALALMLALMVAYAYASAQASSGEEGEEDETEAGVNGVKMGGAGGKAIKLGPPPSQDIKGLCGIFEYGAPPSHPKCRPTSTGGVGLHYEHDISGSASLGPEVNGAKEMLEFKGPGTKFMHTTELWSDAPCFTRKPTCSMGLSHWNPKKGHCTDIAGGTTKFSTCPSYQNRVGQKKHCGKIPGPGKCKYCYPITKACPGCGCMDEEIYPGCGALKAPKGGVKVERITLSGTYVAPFDDKNIKNIHKDTCKVLCPCSTPKAGCAYDLPGYNGYQVDKCTAEDFAAYQECNGGKVNGKDVVPAFKTPTANAWKNFYSSFQAGDQFSTPIMFMIDKIFITPLSAKQVTYLGKHCKCKTWTKGKAVDVSKCTSANCDYLNAKGLFAVVSDLNCPKDKRCLFASVYLKHGLYLYMSRVQPTFAQVVKSPIYADGVYTFKGRGQKGKNTAGDMAKCGAASGASALQHSTLFVAAIAMIAMAAQR